MSTFEEIALFEYIQSKPEGSVLRQIAERYLNDLSNRNVMCYPENPIRKPNGVVPPVSCLNTETGDIYLSIKKASEWIGIGYGTLKWDIQQGVYKYNIIPLKFL